MRFAKKIYVGLVFVFLYAPILILMLYSFNDSRSRGKWGGFTLKWYGELFSDAETMEALKTTILIALRSAVIATIVGTVTAFGMHYMKNGVKKAADDETLFLECPAGILFSGRSELTDIAAQVIQPLMHTIHIFAFADIKRVARPVVLPCMSHCFSSVSFILP